ncbi:hypothetical protein GCM10020000_47350 [Streptomyces olivoverticillatus]
MTHSRPRISKAVIPAAGLGTRFLPATKATPKEMLPVVDKPAIQYVVEEAVHAGLSDVLMVTGRNKRPLEDHFDRNYELEEALRRKGDESRLARVQESSDLATMHYVRQGDPRGLGHAVLCAAPHVGNEPFAVLLGDDLIDARDPLLSRMVDIQRRHGGSVIALLEVDHTQIGLYGCAEVKPTDTEDVVEVTGLVEKPDPEEAPQQFRHHRPLRPGSGHLRRAARDQARPRRRDPAHRRPPVAGRRTGPRRARARRGLQGTPL